MPSITETLNVMITGSAAGLSAALSSSRKMIMDFQQRVNSSMPVVKARVALANTKTNLQADLKNVMRPLAGSALPGVGDLFGALTQGPGRAVEAMGALVKGVSGVGSALSALGSGIPMIGGLFSGLSSIFGMVGSAIGGIAQAGGAVLSWLGQAAGEIVGMGAKVGMGVGALAAYSVVLAAEAEQVEASFKVMIGAGNGYKEVLGDLKEYAANTPFSSKEIMDGARQLLAYGTSANQLIPALTALGEVAAGTQTPINDLTYLYGTLQTQGRAFARDIYQFAGRGIPIQEELAKVMKVSTTQIMGMVEEGKIGFPQVVAAFKNMTSEGGRFYGMTAEHSNTVIGLWNALKDNVLLALADIGKVLTEELGIKGVLTNFTAATQEIRANIETWRAPIAAFATYVKAGVQVAYNALKYFLAFIEQTGKAIMAQFPETFKDLLGGAKNLSEWTVTFDEARLAGVKFGEQIVSTFNWIWDSLEDARGQAMSLVNALIEGAGAIKDAWMSVSSAFGVNGSLTHGMAANYLQAKINLADLRGDENARKKYQDELDFITKRRNAMLALGDAAEVQARMQKLADYAVEQTRKKNQPQLMNYLVTEDRWIPDTELDKLSRQQLMKLEARVKPPALDWHRQAYEEMKNQLLSNPAFIGWSDDPGVKQQLRAQYDKIRDLALDEARKAGAYKPEEMVGFAWLPKDLRAGSDSTIKTYSEKVSRYLRDQREQIEKTIAQHNAASANAGVSSNSIAGVGGMAITLALRPNDQAIKDFAAQAKRAPLEIPVTLVTADMYKQIDELRKTFRNPIIGFKEDVRALADTASKVMAAQQKFEPSSGLGAFLQGQGAMNISMIAEAGKLSNLQALDAFSKFSAIEKNLGLGEVQTPAAVLKDSKEAYSAEVQFALNGGQVDVQQRIENVLRAIDEKQAMEIEIGNALLRALTRERAPMPREVIPR